MLVAGTGAYHFRRVIPVLGSDRGTERLRQSGAVELGVGAAVLLVTAVMDATALAGENAPQQAETASRSRESRDGRVPLLTSSGTRSGLGSSGNRLQETVARLFAPTTRLGTDTAVLVILRMHVTFGPACTARGRTRRELRAQHRPVGGGLPRKHVAGRHAGIEAVEIEPDASD